MKLTFLGATETVTGSKYLVEHGGRRVLIDCGLFQGTKNLRLRNWNPLPLAPDTLDAVVLTHAHIDHTGYLPVLVREGYRGPVYCTAATAELCDIMLRDSARLQEEEAEFANRHGYSKHHPAQPLYTLDDAQRALRLLKPVALDECTTLGGGLAFRLLPAGHILGAASVVMHGNHKVLAFSGDLGRYHDPIMQPPRPPAHADYLVVESTYGDRLHPASDPENELAMLFDTTFARGGVVVMPCFTVGRAQEILHYIARLKASGRMARVPVFLDSPMATDVTDCFDSRAGDPVAEVMKLTDGIGVDCAIEAVGIPATFEMCTALVAPGGVVANVGVHGVKADLHLEKLWDRNIAITTRLVDTVSTPMLLKTVRAGRLDPKRLITHRFSLDDVERAYDTFGRAAQTHALKVIIEAG